MAAVTSHRPSSLQRQVLIMLDELHQFFDSRKKP